MTTTVAHSSLPQRVLNSNAIFCDVNPESINSHALSQFSIPYTFYSCLFRTVEKHCNLSVTTIAKAWRGGFVMHGTGRILCSFHMAFGGWTLPLQSTVEMKHNCICQ